MMAISIGAECGKGGPLAPDSMHVRSKGRPFSGLSRQGDEGSGRPMSGPM